MGGLREPTVFRAEVTTVATSAPLAASTARSYALVGFIFYLLAALGWGIALVAVGVTVPLWIGQVPWTKAIWFPFVFPLGMFTAVGIGFAWWSWTALKQIDRGRYMTARTSSLILGVFGVFLAFFVGGLFFLLAYGRLGEVLQPSTTFPTAGFRVCMSCGRAIAVDAKFCSYCGKGLPA